MSLVLYDVRDNLALITLNNPKKRNMLTAEVCNAISEYVSVAENDASVKALIVTGAGGAFCAGGQLSDIHPDQSMLEQIYSGFLSIANCSLPTIAAVNGPAVGAGFNMAIGCDVRIVTKKALFEPRFFGLGLHPGGGSTWMTRSLANWDTAAGLLLFSHSLTGEEAVLKGIAWKCVEEAVLLEEAFDFASNIKDIPKEILVRTKQTLREAGVAKSHRDIIDIETQQQIWSLKQPYAHKAIATKLKEISSRKSTPKALD